MASDSTDAGFAGETETFARDPLGPIRKDALVCFVILSPETFQGAPDRLSRAEEGETDPRLDNLNDTLKHGIIESVANPLNYQVLYNLQFDQEGGITPPIIQRLAEADIVVADLRNSFDPYTMYQLALRHASGLPVIHITKPKQTLKFRMRDMSVIGVDLQSSDSCTDARRALGQILFDLATNRPRSAEAPLAGLKVDFDIASSLYSYRPPPSRDRIDRRDTAGIDPRWLRQTEQRFDSLALMLTGVGHKVDGLADRLVNLERSQPLGTARRSESPLI